MSVSELHFFSFAIRFQFFIKSFSAKAMRGTLPTSSSTPIFEVWVWTPSSCFRNFIWTNSIMLSFLRSSLGLFFNILRNPQKSEQYKIMGFIKVSNKYSDIAIFSLKWIPIFFLSCTNAYKALAFRSRMPVFTSPLGVTRNPRYLYSRVEFMIELP